MSLLICIVFAVLYTYFQDMCSFVDILYMLLGLYAELLTLLFPTLTHFSLQSGVFVKFLYFVLLKFYALLC